MDDSETAISETRRLALAAIDGALSAHEAFRIASTLMVQCRELADEIAARRAQAAVRIRDEEALSLSELATRLGISKPRAGQLVQQQKKDKPDE